MRRAGPPPRRQQGVTLIELMVGILIGLMVVAVAGVALMASRGISGTVRDASDIQQQAAYVMRVIGQQARQAGALHLNLTPDGLAEDVMGAVQVEFVGLGHDELPITDDGTSVTIQYTDYEVPVFTQATKLSLSRNCLGMDGGGHPVKNVFKFDITDHVLRCGSDGAGLQPIIGNVANFQLRYLVQDNRASPGSPTIAYIDTVGSVSDWRTVQGVEVCLVLFGTEAISLPAGSSYTDCDHSSIDMTSLTGERAKRMHLVFRNVFQLRSQGLM